MLVLQYRVKLAQILVIINGRNSKNNESSNQALTEPLANVARFISVLSSSTHSGASLRLGFGEECPRPRGGTFCQSVITSLWERWTSVLIENGKA